MIYINYIEEYQYAVDKGFRPLMDWHRFAVSFPLRLELQFRLFGKNALGHGKILRANDLFYHYCWDNHWLFNGYPIHVCEECMKPLRNYSSVYISHILSRGSKANMAHDPRNFNLLCFDHHNIWEKTPRKLKIYESNSRLIKILRSDYGSK